MTSPYTPLPNATSIRVLLLAPGTPDSEIHCWLLPCDLDADHSLSLSTTSRPFTWPYPFTTPTEAFKLEIDCNFTTREEDDLIGLPPHPFQRYTALSYVWGSQANPKHIILNGSTRFPVTQNLHEALHALRKGCDWSGIKLWVDAVCINQGDHAEKKEQIALMRRVYRQAEEVVAYVHLGRQDAENVGGLLEAIHRAYARWKENVRGITVRPKSWVENAVVGESGDGGDERGVEAAKEVIRKNVDMTDKNESATGDIEMGPGSGERIDTSGMHYLDALALAQEEARSRSKAKFIEDFGLPPVNSPPWRSWRRLFASPYFRRIWILQEFAVARNLKLQLGDRVSCDFTVLMSATQYLASASGANNAMYLGHSAPGDPDEMSGLTVAGSRGLGSMAIERAQWGLREGLFEKGEAGGDLDGEERLVKKLGRARQFKASDERDKVYAVLGLAADGHDATWQELVSYAPEVTKYDVYARFARAMVQLGEGFDVLLQAGICDASSEGKLPSWVPDWSDGVYPSGEAKRTVPASTKSIRLHDDNMSLIIPGKQVDEISTVSSVAFVNQGARNSLGMKMEELDSALWAGWFEISQSLVMEDLMEVPTESLVREILRRLTKALAESEELFDILVQEDDPGQRAALRKGFASYAKMKTAGFSHQIAEDFTRGGAASRAHIAFIGAVDDPHDLQIFMSRVTQSAWGTRLCTTESGRIGLVPDQTKVSDVVVVFESCQVAFILRKDGTEEGGYNLVGHGYFCRREGEQQAYDTAEDIEEDILLV